MFRTRNFAVMAVLISAGSLGAVAALFDASILGKGQMASLGFADGTESLVEAILPDKQEPDRESRIRELKEKISARTVVEIPTEIAEVAATSTEETSDDIEEELAGELRCGSYSMYSGGWNSSGVKIAESEGVRLVFKEVAATGSSTAPSKQILAELPVRSAPSSGRHCIASDVIGISTNGALIRNDESRAYAGFGASTLIGYTLDGFPLYGGLAQKADACGGAVVHGQYRYGLSAERDVVINCFASAPITL